MNPNRRHALARLAGLAAALAAGPALAQNYPSKPITLVVSYPAGGDTDAMARLFAEKLAGRLGQPVVVDNRPGASGTIGNAWVAKAAPDGHTLLLTPSTFSIAPLLIKSGAASAYDPLNDFTPIVQTGVQPLFLVAHPGLGVKDLRQLVAAAKGGKALAYASPGSGSPMHILGELFNKAAQVQISHVPYRGVAPAVNDLLGGHVPLAWMTYGPVAPYLSNGKLLALAVAERQRSKLAPGVPTLAELGVKDVEVSAWQGLMAPRGLPPEIAKRLNTEFNEILRIPEVAGRMQTFGALPTGGPASRLAQANAADHARYGQLIKSFGIQAD
ncbi:tripartite tricarboxylate transporter substrate binding protein [Ramlibacter sp. 2FC]|uniref:Bug family tripartite tricarboxylate transporter substrate binding protein n=1 Tax=Ramlibacter sp. 2FC TaxID=2502188 RepID=UPI0010F5343C|nr:tripartite tricarboxylate transporter substrate binding protein [Ramlibacter sp. 2FC]